jgi:hypothetical protein
VKVRLFKPTPFPQPYGFYAANDLSGYANIPVPTSYMIADTEADFFRGYDHRAEAGFVHAANHHNEDSIGDAMANAGLPK